MLRFEHFRLIQKFLETIKRIIKEQSLVQRPADSRAEEGIVPFLGDIQSERSNIALNHKSLS